MDELASRGRVTRETVEAAFAEEVVLVGLLASLRARVSGASPPDAGQGGDEDEREDPPWIQAKFRLALDRYAATDLFGALRITDALLHLEPDAVLGPQLRALQRRCHDRLVETSLLVARVVAARSVLSRNSPLKLSIHFKNVSDQVIVLHQDAKTDSVGVVHLDYEELSPDGTRTRIRTQHGVSLGVTKLRLGAGQAKSISLRLPAPHKRLPRGVVGRYEIMGRLRPTRMQVGDSTASSFLPLGKSQLMVLDPKDRSLAKDPAKSLAAAVKAANSGTLAQRREPARQAFVAGVLFAHRDREPALRALIDALGTATAPLSDSLCAALARANGEPLSLTREEWLAWWTQRGPRGGEPKKMTPEKGE
jgi:hypothetical protein